MEREETLDKRANQAGLSLLFANGKRPSAGDIERLLASADLAAAAACVSYRPSDEAEGMVELLISGLTFDLYGLSPGTTMPIPPERHRFGTLSQDPLNTFDAITLVPAQHIASGFAMIPVVQAMAGLAAHIALPLGAEAVCWHPAQSWMEPHYFARIVLGWLSGGAFPALGLTALRQNREGFGTEGLAFFVNQELQIESLDGEAIAHTARLAIRLIDHVTVEGPFTRDGLFDDFDGERLHIELSDSSRLATVRRFA